MKINITLSKVFQNKNFFLYPIKRYFLSDCCRMEEDLISNSSIFIATNTLVNLRAKREISNKMLMHRSSGVDQIALHSMPWVCWQ